jgi:hypothetical protein
MLAVIMGVSAVIVEHKMRIVKKLKLGQEVTGMVNTAKLVRLSKRPVISRR